ncbi:unnamed protein product [Cylicocyclus nassatus]|uniref:Uncharacterized protein n=1 Tax=Cylicocyclus nassatus TaxID=53992 RepID=A0AA36DMF7_CYLNA|nr:unnamed protein product [Cylicocyclus nassatus]
MKKAMATRPKLAAAPRRPATGTVSAFSQATQSVVRAPSTPPLSGSGSPRVYHELQPLTFYLALGQSENELQKKLDELLADFDLYKAEILKEMQLAL